MKHTPKLMKATITVGKSKNDYDVIVDKYSNNRYKVIAGADFLIGREYRYGHGLSKRRKLTAEELQKWGLADESIPLGLQLKKQ